MRKGKLFAFAFVAMFMFFQCKEVFGQALLVAAASSMRDVLEEIGPEFEKESGYKMHFTFGSTGGLAHEIEGGIPYDVYIAAGNDFIQELYHRKLLVPDTAYMICKGKLTIIVRRDSLTEVKNIHDVTHFPLIAIANPQHAPYGRAAKQALEGAGLWLKLQNKILYADRVMDVHQLVEDGKVSVGIGAMVLKASAEVKYVPVEDKLYTPLEYHIAMVKGTRHREAAKSFADFLASDAGKTILKKWGFSLP